MLHTYKDYMLEERMRSPSSQGSVIVQITLTKPNLTLIQHISGLIQRLPRKDFFSTTDKWGAVQSCCDLLLCTIMIVMIMLLWSIKSGTLGKNWVSKLSMSCKGSTGIRGVVVLRLEGQALYVCHRCRLSMCVWQLALMRWQRMWRMPCSCRNERGWGEGYESEQGCPPSN